MVLSIVENDLPTSCTTEYAGYVLDNTKVNIKDENAVSVDTEVTGKNKLRSLEGLERLEYYFKDYDIRMRWSPRNGRQTGNCSTTDRKQAAWNRKNL